MQPWHVWVTRHKYKWAIVEGDTVVEVFPTKLEFGKVAYYDCNGHFLGTEDTVDWKTLRVMYHTRQETKVLFSFGGYYCEESAGNFMRKEKKPNAQWEEPISDIPARCRFAHECPACSKLGGISQMYDRVTLKEINRQLHCLKRIRDNSERGYSCRTVKNAILPIKLEMTVDEAIDVMDDVTHGVFYGTNQEFVKAKEVLRLYGKIP